MATIPFNQQFHTVSNSVNTIDRGSAQANSMREVYSMQDIIDTIPSSSGVSGSNSVYVKAEGTEAENGALLLNGLTEAIAKIKTITVPGTNIPIGFYQQDSLITYNAFAEDPVIFSAGSPYSATFDGQSVLIEIIQVGMFGPESFQFDITDTNGNPISFGGTPDFPTPSATAYEPSTLIIAPGNYDIASDFIVNDLVNVTSLTGQPDVNITGSNVKIQSGANSLNNPISIVGLNLTTTSLWIESNLSSLNFKNCRALGGNSFSIEPSGTGAITGSFEDCVGAYQSFGGGVGVTAAGLFVRCKITSGPSGETYSFGGKGNTSGRFEFCGGYSVNEATAFISSVGNAFCKEGVNCGGSFYYCTASDASFASNNTGATTAEFYNCIAGNQSFAYKNSNNSGKFYDCKAVDSGSQSFGAEPQGGDLAPNALYHNCISEGNIARNAVGSSSKFYNCHAKLSWQNYSAGNNGLAYNCYFGSFGGQGSVTGTGKYRNCLDSTFTIINEG